MVDQMNCAALLCFEVLAGRVQANIDSCAQDALNPIKTIAVWMTQLILLESGSAHERHGCADDGNADKKERGGRIGWPWFCLLLSAAE